MYDEQTGKPVKSGGKLVPRYSGKFAPCRYPALGCLKGTPEESNALNERNAAAYIHWQTCKATNRFPDDPIVARNARLIQSVYDAEEREHREVIKALTLSIGGLARGGR